MVHVLKGPKIGLGLGCAHGPNGAIRVAWPPGAHVVCIGPNTRCAAWHPMGLRCVPGLLGLDK
jgi:hypothetical protein